MVFADLKNDFVFRRIFATHPELLRSLLNKATFTQDELAAYRKVIDEIEQVRELAEAKWNAGLAKGEEIGLAKGEEIGLAKGEAIGIAKGKIAALFAVLSARGLAVTDELRARIDACGDEATLDLWIARATTASSAEEVLASAGPSV